MSTAKVVHTGMAPMIVKRQNFMALKLSTIATDTELIVINNHKYFSAGAVVTLHLATPPGSSAFVTVWWAPSDVRAHNSNMIQSSAMLTDKPIIMSLTVPPCDDVTHMADAIHGIVCFGFRAVATESKTPPPVSIAITATLTGVAGRVASPGIYQLAQANSLELAADTLVKWSA